MVSTTARQASSSHTAAQPHALHPAVPHQHALDLTLHHRQAIGTASTIRSISAPYTALSHCTRGPHTAGPRVALSTRN